MLSGARYHQTKEGGSYHTDSPHWENVPDLVSLFCINQAKKGGISKFVSTYTIHNQILNEQNDKLKTLYGKFYFDKRGEFQTNESKTIFEPVFVFENGKLHCRYLRNYIISGHELENVPLSPLQKDSIDLLEQITQVPENILSYDLKTNDMIFFDNHRMLHGRTEFEDYEEEFNQAGGEFNDPNIPKDPQGNPDPDYGNSIIAKVMKVMDIHDEVYRSK